MTMDRLALPDLIERLDGMIDCFNGINRMTEQTFLRLGEQVQQSYGLVREISGLIHDTLHALLEDKQQGFLEQLRQLVNQCLQWLDENSRRQAQIDSSLAGIGRHAETFGPPLFGLRKVTKVLHSLRVTTRIEASKSGEAGAQVLSGSLGDLAQLILNKLDEIETLIEQLGAINSLASASDRQSNQSLLNQAWQDAADLENRLARYHDSRDKLSQWSIHLQMNSTQINRNFEELVAALQYQDITRQRLEHLQGSLQNLRERLAGLDTGRRQSADLATIGNICALQYEQLQACVRDFTTAIDSLQMNLRQMADSVTTLADTTRHFFQNLGGAWLEHHRQVSGILETISGQMRITHADQNFSRAALGGVCQSIQQVVSLVDEVEFIGEEMQLLALNAAVNAAHTRMLGSGLTIIADNIHTLSEESIGLSERLAETCQLIDNQAHDLSRMETADQKQVELLDSLLNQSEQLSGDLQTNAESLEETCHGIAAGAQTLSHDVLDAVRLVDIKDHFAAQIGEVLAVLAEYAGWSDTSLDLSELSHEELLKQLEQNYTMSSERKVHREFMTQITPDEVGPVTDEESEPLGRQHDLGDNVVLF